MTFVIQELTQELLQSHRDSFFATLRNLTQAEDIPLERSQEILQQINSQWKYLYVAVHEDGNIVGHASLMIEQKFIRSGALAAHVEDVVTREGYQWQGIASALMQHLVQIAKEKKCYKIILDCEEHLTWYYEKFGFVHKGSFMNQYL